MKAFAILAIAAAPCVASAQTSDIAADFGKAFELFYPGGDATPLAALTFGPGPLVGIEGRWLPAQQAFLDGAYDPEFAADFCERGGYEFAARGQFGFTITQVRRDEPTDAVVTYSFVGGNTFARTADLDGVAAMMFGDRDLSTMPPAMVLGSLSQPSFHGYALVHRFTADVLVIEGITIPPAIYTRCPDTE